MLPVRDNRHGQTYRPASESFCAEIEGSKFNEIDFDRDSTDATKHSGSAALAKSGNTGGNIEPDSDRYNAFRDLLTSSGFTEAQLMLIADALRETGLRVSVVDECPSRQTNHP
jgi:hypothetical protein